MGGFKDPVGVFCVGYRLVVPFDLEVAGGLFEKGRTGEGVHIQLRFRGHGCGSW